MRKTKAIILAAGKGVRMRSDKPKALCEISGMPMVEFLIETAQSCGIKDIVVVGGYKISLLRKKLSSYNNIKIAEQKKLLGSGDAVKQAARHFKNFNGTALVLYADTPLIKASTIKRMLSRHAAARSSATLLTVKTDDPKEYGRIQRDEKGKICGIVEYTDVSAAHKNTQYAIRNTQYEINVGAYCFDSKRLFQGLKRIKKNKIKGEFYLTDIISHFYDKGYLVTSHVTGDADEGRGINRREELQAAEEILRKRAIDDLIRSGVTIKDTATTYIQKGVKIARGTIINPFVVIEKNVTIGRDCKIGPFAHLRPGTVLEKGCVVGNFVEIVRSKLGSFSRAKHHTYLGDARVGRNVNIGAGTITANYDGKKKHITTIDHEAFIGSGTTIIAPVKIGRAAVTGAGSVVVRGRDVAPRTIVAGVPARPLRSK
ncbi:MAG: sugar phosphate nucleotidyltransferase [Candidatus Omnitrophota bacterium]